jgi:Gpi18-like mannosyltransferase
MKAEFKRIAIVAAFTLIPTILIWLPFLFRLPTFWKIPLKQDGLATIVANYDGPLYLIVSKTFYNKEAIKTTYQFPLATEYYTAHFPLFPALIRAVSTFTNSPYAMLLVTLGSSFLAIYFFHKLSGNYFLTFLFSIFPARWLIVRSVGSADPLFIAAIIASIYFFKNKKYLWAGVWGAIAQFTKSPAILLFISYLIYLFFSKNFDIKKYLAIFLMPASLILVFCIYYFTQGDFFAYFRSGDNIHLFFPPFQIFNYSTSWVGTFWLEEIIFVYLIGALGTIRLFMQKHYEYATFTAIFFLSTIFVSHRDLIRYSLPIVPFLILAFSDTILKKEFRIALGVIIIPIYLFSLAYITQNVMPISNWGPFL